ncbi:MAG: hypothetical protein NT062_08785 [Proteobacteria bacterium]|nr:hypothetical protein [Pseudomonadota bacterium]
MARQRRGGFKPPELKGTLGSLLRTTIQQAGVVRDVLARGVSEGRARIDDTRANRRRQDALAELGEIVLELVRRGEIDPTELPEVHDVLHTLDELDGEPSDHAHDHSHSHSHSHDDDDDDRVTIPPTRSRFDARGPRAASPTIAGSTHRRAAEADDTVSSRAARVVPPAAAVAAQRVWRPTPIDAPEQETPAEPRPVAPAFRAKAMVPPPRRGGISFDDEEDADLADYMHPDDVPAKPTDA